MNRILNIFVFLFSSLTCFTQELSIKPVDINMENVSYPFPVHYITRIIQGETLKMAFMDVQPQQPNGRSIVLLHGKNFSGAYWETTAKELSKNGYRVIIPDQIGFGKSDKPQHIQYSFQLLAIQTKSILDSLHILKVTVLGHSMGGMLATRFALMYPEMLDKLILEDPIGLEDWKLKVPYQSVDDWYKSELKQNLASIKKYQQESYYHGTWKPEYDKWVVGPAGWTLSADYPKIAWNSALTYDMIFTQPVVYEFNQIKTPTLLIVGLLDRTALGKNLVPENIRQTMGDYPVLGRQTAQKIRGSKLVEIPGTGHIPHIESFEKFIAAILPFLSQ